MLVTGLQTKALFPARIPPPRLSLTRRRQLYQSPPVNKIAIKWPSDYHDLRARDLGRGSSFDGGSWLKAKPSISTQSYTGWRHKGRISALYPTDKRWQYVRMANAMIKEKNLILHIHRVSRVGVWRLIPVQHALCTMSVIRFHCIYTVLIKKKKAQLSRAIYPRTAMHLCLIRN